MSTRKITGIIKNISNKFVTQIKKIDRSQIKKIATLTSLLVVLPLAVQADSDVKPSEPLSSEQSQKLTANLAQFSPTAKKEVVPVKIEVAPDPEPQPPIQESAPEPAPSPTRVRVAANRTSRKIARNATRRTSTGKNVVGASYEQCVPFARELSGVQIRGYAGNIKPNSSDASVGSVALFAGYGHAAVVTGVNGDNVTIKEANYVPGQITERTVPKSQLRGYVK